MIIGPQEQLAEIEEILLRIERKINHMTATLSDLDAAIAEEAAEDATLLTIIAKIGTDLAKLESEVVAGATPAAIAQRVAAMQANLQTVTGAVATLTSADAAANPPPPAAASAVTLLAGSVGGTAINATVTTTINGNAVAYTETTADVDLPTLAAHIGDAIVADQVVGKLVVAASPVTGVNASLVPTGDAGISLTALVTGVAGNAITIAVSTTDPNLQYTIAGGATTLSGGA